MKNEVNSTVASILNKLQFQRHTKCKCIVNQITILQYIKSQQIKNYSVGKKIKIITLLKLSKEQDIMMFSPIDNRKEKRSIPFSRIK